MYSSLSSLSLNYSITEPSLSTKKPAKKKIGFTKVEVEYYYYRKTSENARIVIQGRLFHTSLFNVFCLVDSESFEMSKICIVQARTV